ncbi:copper amine oxidase N-terminal domain-containing protein [bacterium]|nr:copper amine oxidase N-terminal domain-containing protein [bacterium]
MNYKNFCSWTLALVLFFSIVPFTTSAVGSFPLTLKPGCDEIVLSWKAVTGAVNYQPFMFLASGSTYPIIDFPANILDYTHKGLTEGKEYCYEVLAYDKDAKVIARSPKVCSKPKCDEEMDECKIVLKYTVGKLIYYVNNVPFEMETEPEIRMNRMFLVITYVIKHIPGATIEWDDALKMITIKTPAGKTIRLWIDNPKAEVNGAMVDIDPANPGYGAPFIVNGRTKAPMRFIAEQLDAKVDWYGSTNTVVLTIEDVVNCACEWTEGCSTQLTSVSDNLYQVNFYPSCDKTKEPTTLYMNKSLRSEVDQLNLKEYFVNHDDNEFVNYIFCIKEDKIRKWDPGTNEEDPKLPTDECCSFSIERKTPEIEELESGKFYTYEYIVTNTCETGLIKIMETRGIGIPEMRRVDKIAPAEFTLEAWKTKTIAVYFSMPEHVENGQLVDYVFYLKSQCEDSTIDTRFSVKCKTGTNPPPDPEDCCEFKFDRITDEIDDLEPGKSYTYEYKVTNVCDTKEMKIEAQKLSNIDSVTPSSFTLAPDGEQVIAVVFTMPENEKNRSAVVFSFKLRADCDFVKVVSFHLKSQEGDTKGRIIVKMDPENFKGTSFKITLKGTEEVVEFAEGSENIDLEKGIFDTGCILECRSTYIVTPIHPDLKFSPAEKVVVINHCCPDGAEEIKFETDP